MHNQQLFVYLFLLTGVMSSANNSENEMSSVEAAHSTTSSYDDEGKLHIIVRKNVAAQKGTSIIAGM